MKIIIDARWIFPEISGIGLYTVELLRALTELDKKNEYILLFSDQDVLTRTSDDLDLKNASNFSTQILPFGVFSIKSQLQMPAYLRREAADVFHSMNYMIPMTAFSRRSAKKTKCVITIHDLIPLLFPSHAPKSKKARMMPLYRFVMKQVSARANAILTVSENSARDIRNLLLPCEEDHSKVIAAYNGVSDSFRELEWKPSHDPQRLLYVGRLDPYKNVTGLMRILKGVLDQTSRKVKLVIAGSRDSRYPEAEILARELNIEEHIEWTGYITPDKLLDLYTEASILVHPSHYEGFGLPVAEAMAAGLPVVCSSGGSLAEIAGEAAKVHDHRDEDAFVESICALLDSTSLSRELSIKGRKQAAQFTWSNAAEITLQTYRRAVEGEL